MRLKVLVSLLLVMFLAGIPAVWGKDYGTITSGFTLSHEIDAISKMDMYHFTGQKGQQILFNAVSTAASLDTAISLYAPSGAKETHTYDGWGNGGDRLDWTLKETGSYSILVEDNNYKDVGNYAVSFLLLPPGPFTYAGDLDGGAITSGQTKAAKINAASDMDTYRFTGQIGQHILFNAVSTSPSLDTAISLYAPSGAKETHTYDGWGNGGDRLDWTLKEAGTYNIVVEDNNYNETGDYQISFLLLSSSSLTYAGDLDGGAITSGQTKAAKINAASDMDTYRFTGQIGQHILFNAVSTSPSLDTAISLYAPSGAKETHTYDGWGNGGDRLDWNLKEAGTYNIVVEDNNYNETGDYQISFLLLSSSSLTYAGDLDGGAITSGQTKAAKINAASDMDTYRFTGQIGQQILFNAVSTAASLDTVISLYAPSGAKETHTYDGWGNGGDRLDWTLKEAGTYNIVVEDNNYNEIGDYQISFLLLPNSSLTYAGDLDGGAITSGQTKAAKINAASDMDAYQFYATGGERIIVNAVSILGYMDTAISLYAPSGAKENHTYDGWGGGGDRLECTLKEDGLYTIVVEDNNYHETGDYNLSFLMLSGKVYYTKATFTYYYNNGKGDRYNGTVYGRQDNLYYTGYKKPTPTVSGKDENGQTGYYLISDYSLITETSKLGQVFVDTYYDAETKKYYDPVSKGKAVGTDCLGSEVDYLSPVADGSVRFGKYDNIFWEADIGASPEYNKYSFKYTYGSTLEYYTGVVYAGAGKGYYAGKKLTFPRFDENKLFGTYEITGAFYDPAITTAMLGQVFVDSYYDAESASPYTPLRKGKVVGTNYLGSEMDYIVRTGVIEFKFGLGYWEADVGNRYTFRYTYENKDYYEGWVYASPTYGYYPGRKIYKKNETGKTGYYEITGMSYNSIYNSMDKQVFVANYFDGDMSAKPYTPTLGPAPAGTSYLGSEAGYIVKAGNPDFYFGKGYYEADVGDRFAFMYSYGNEDFYTGYVYADPSKYYLGWESAKENELRETGWYEIIGKTYTGKTSEYGKVYVNGYVNGDQDGKVYTPINPTVAKGSSHLGSETGYILRNNVAAYKFGQGYWEADVGDRYSFIYTYGNGDFYTGYVYAAPTYGYYPGWKKATGYNEVQEQGWYRITGMSYQGVSASLYGKIIVKSYFDGSATDAYYTPLSAGTYFGLNYLGSEYGYIKVLNNAAYKFGGGYEETDGS